jgi:hypothetical protein
MEKQHVLIGKFDILATYTYVKAVLEGEAEPEAKVRGMVAAVMGAQAKLGHTRDYQAHKEAAEEKKKSSITAASFDRQVAEKMGDFFDRVFLPGIKRLVEARLSYVEVKSLLKIPSTWGTKITGSQFEERVRTP